MILVSWKLRKVERNVKYSTNAASKVVSSRLSFVYILKSLLVCFKITNSKTVKVTVKQGFLNKASPTTKNIGI